MSATVRGQGGGGGFSIPGLGGGGGGLGFPMKAGGGLLGLIVLAAAIFLPRLLGGGSQPVSAPSLGGADGSDSLGPTQCETEIEQVICGGTDDVAVYWIGEFPQAFNGRQYEETFTQIFSGAINTACGQATSQVGPFYCPADQLVYFDLEFLQQLQQQFGATGDLAAQYIVAHEYGHHVQNLLGISDRGQPSLGSRIRVEPTSTRSPSSCRRTASPAPGPTTRSSAVSSSPVRSARHSTPRPRSAMTASSSRRRARSIPRHGPTAHRSNACRGSGAASRRVTPTAATRSASSRPTLPLTGYPPRTRYTHSNGPMPKRRWYQAAKAMATAQYTGSERERRVEPRRADPPEPVDDEVEHQGMRDVQRQGHRTGMAEQLDRSRA